MGILDKIKGLFTGKEQTTGQSKQGERKSRGDERRSGSEGRRRRPEGPRTEGERRRQEGRGQQQEGQRSRQEGRGPRPEGPRQSPEGQRSSQEGRRSQSEEQRQSRRNKEDSHPLHEAQPERTPGTSSTKRRRRRRKPGADRARQPAPDTSAPHHRERDQADQPETGGSRQSADRSGGESRRHGDDSGTEGSSADGGTATAVAERRRSSSHRKSRDGRSRKLKTELGGTEQAVEFPELLPVDEYSEEFRENEFRPLGLSDKAVLALAANRFRTPTDIQLAVIPLACQGKDILGQAKTGTGKTVAFLMPIFERIDLDSPTIQALIVVPTRELCRQVSWEARRFGRSLGAHVMSVYGGTAISREKEQLAEGPQIMVGTPGRLLDHIFNTGIDLSRLKVLVLDEADRMFDIGFRPDIVKIINACPNDRQIMLLSATLDDEVEEMARRYMQAPELLYLSRDEITVESIWQRFIHAERREKLDKLSKLLAHQKPTQAIIFTNTKRMSDALSLRLNKIGYKTTPIHSDLSQSKRERVMDGFRTGKIEYLVATDVAARGLDITGISHVINYDVPDRPEDYLHRVGRTGRMGAAGKAFTFVGAEEGDQLSEIEKLMNKQLEEWEEEA